MVDISVRLQFYKIIIDTFSLDEPITFTFSSWSANLMMFNSDVIAIQILLLIPSGLSTYNYVIFV